MSRKHFIAFAKAISEITDLEERARVARLVAHVCESCNPNFSYQTFYSACGLYD